MFLVNKSSKLLHQQIPDNDYLHKKWTIVYFNTTVFDLNNSQSEIEYQLFRLSIETFRVELNINIDEIYVYSYSYQVNYPVLCHLISEYNIHLLEIPQPHDQTTKLSIMNKYMSEEKNIIMLNHLTACVYTSGKLIMNYLDNSTTIYAPFHVYHETNTDIYVPICRKFGLNKIVNCNIIIIPFILDNHKCIETALIFSKQIHSSDVEFATNIALTMINKKSDCSDLILEDLILEEPIHDIVEIKCLLNIVTYHYDQCVHNLVSELREHGNCSINWKKIFCTQNKLLTCSPVNNIHYVVRNELDNDYIMYDDPNYLFYPNLDIYAPLVKLPKLCYDEQPYLLPDVFNTNGYKPNLNCNDKCIPINSKLFKRFVNKTSGIFIKKKIINSCQNVNSLGIPLITNPLIIPKILHHVWLGKTIVEKYTNAWNKILRVPWIYKIWTESDIIRDVFEAESTPNRWSILFKNTKCKTIKLLIAELAIVEKYGGIVISGFVIPLKLWSDEFLMQKFFMSFRNEEMDRTKICYRIMGSIKTLDVSSHIYQILTNVCDEDDDQMYRIDKTILSDPDITIYPSYYFNPVANMLPKKLLNQTVCINLWKK